MLLQSIPIEGVDGIAKKAFMASSLASDGFKEAGIQSPPPVDLNACCRHLLEVSLAPFQKWFPVPVHFLRALWVQRRKEEDRAGFAVLLVIRASLFM